MQYMSYLGNLLRGDLGTSMINGTSVSKQIAYVLPYTLNADCGIGLVRYAGRRSIWAYSRR